MNTVTVRNVTIGEGIPKICVPIVGTTKDDILKEAGEICCLGADVIEWRADWYKDVLDYNQVRETAALLREQIGNIPLLFTFRTAKEGGKRKITAEQYVKLNEEAAGSGKIDLLDVELFTGENEVKTIIKNAHEKGVKVIASNHDFDKTPDKDEIICRFKKMQEYGADILKAAVMPQNKKDVLTLLAATEEMTAKYADRPVITMSMGGTGVISRICGEVFGSALTFGAAGKASAPGQMGVEDLRTVLTILNKSMA